MLAEEQAIYPVQGSLELAGAPLAQHTMAVVSEAMELVATDGPARFAVVGGQPLGHRFNWWNFVSSRKARIEQAKVAWTQCDASSGIGPSAG